MKNLLLLFVIFTTVALAQPGNMGYGLQRMGMRMTEKLNLTDEQREQVDKFHSELQKKQIALRSKIQTLRIDVRDAFREEKPDRGKIESKLGEITKLQAEMRMNHVAFWFEVNKILTPEQQKLWREAPMMHPRWGDGKQWRMRMMQRMMDRDEDD